MSDGPILGHDRAIGQFLEAWSARRLHHAWLLAGPRGTGKASFARAAAKRVLADAAGPICSAPGLAVDEDHPTAHLLRAGSHPDFRLLERAEKPAGGLARNISIDQVRALGDMLGITPSLSPWRVILIDSADDLEREGANALLKMLEEPPANTIFLLVAHAPGRLLPTVRSRCRRLEFAPLPDDVMASVLESRIAKEDLARVMAPAAGSVGRAIEIAALDLAPLDALARTIMAEGDPDNNRRAKLASAVTGKIAAERYAAFLPMLPALIAAEARRADEPRRGRALAAYDRAREMVALAPRLTLDPGATMFELGGILASIAGTPASLKR
ncbi:MAG TPA: AAA family ATPase [Sphingomicrobium sp.]|nr:AAA family ATPase [Sphingomicrobium sp.]